MSAVLAKSLCKSLRRGLNPSGHSKCRGLPQLHDQHGGPLQRARGFSTSVPQALQPSVQWTVSELKSMLEQTADTGALELDLHRKLMGCSGQSVDAAGATPAMQLKEEGSQESGTEDAMEQSCQEDMEESGADMQQVLCSLPEFVLVSELCSFNRFRDYVMMGRLAEKLTPLVPQGSRHVTLRLASAYSQLGVLNAPLFEAIAHALLRSWTSTAAELAELTQVARCFAAQRNPHEQLFEQITERIQARLKESLTAVTPAEALSLLHSFVFLRKDSDLGGATWEALEKNALQPGSAELGPAPILEFCHVLFLARRDSDRLEDIVKLLTDVAPKISAIEPATWTSPAGMSLRHHMLMLRSCLRYLHREAYQELPQELAAALKKVHRLEVPDPGPRPVVNFIRTFSHILSKLKVGHMCNAQRGPLLLDIVERDRKVVYECNHFDRFYNGSTQKIASMCLQERIVKGMGYRVVQVPHWQWSKIRHKRQRIEYVRMSRYYAIKDRREFAPRDEPMEDMCANEFDFMGEYFFRKDKPSSAWSWFQPRYDASKRIPPTPEQITTGASA